MKSLYFVLVVSIGLAARAEVTISGDVHPDDASDWTASSDALVGYTGAGSVTVTAGDDLECNNGTIGFWTSSAGDVIIQGSGSSWSNQGSIEVGSYGDGTLSILEGGLVSSRGSTSASAAGRAIRNTIRTAQSRVREKLSFSSAA